MAQNYRSSTGNLAAYPDEPPPGPQRWDPERFMRERERAAQMSLSRRGDFERDRFEKRVSEDRGGKERDTFIRERSQSRGPRFQERDFFEEEKFSRPQRRSMLYEENNYDNSRALAPLSPPNRRPSVGERGYGPPKESARPKFLRRQSSLDTFDRRPKPNYEYERETFRPPVNVPIPLPPRQRRSPPRFYEERDTEEIRIAEPDYYGDEEFREFREREQSRPPVRSTSRYRVKEETFEEEPPKEAPFPRKGKTKMPRRLASREAVIELGYPFEEEGDTMIILKALGKDQIDEVIRVTKEMNNGGPTYHIETAPSHHDEVFEKKSTEIYNMPPPPPEMDTLSVHSRARSRANSEHRSEAKSRRSRANSVRSTHSRRSSSAGPEIVEFGESSSSVGGPVDALVKQTRRENNNTVVIRPQRERESETMFIKPHRERESEAMVIRPRNDRAIKAEIKALEAEKKALKYEREEEQQRKKAERIREVGYDEKTTMRVERDRKGRLSMVRSAQ